MSSKRGAKNEIAKQIYNHLITLESSSMPAAMNSFSDRPTIDPKSMIPLVMTLLTELSHNCYPEMTTLDGIHEMIDEWGSFLEWKNNGK